MRRVPAVLAAAGLAMGAIAARADTLEEAMVSAYLTSPQLEARRAQSRGSNEAISQALANWRPSINLVGQETHERVEGSSSGRPSAQYYAIHAARFTLLQPLYRGGRTVAQTEQAEAQIRADWKKLALVEQTVLLATATAYLNLWRDEAILTLTRYNEWVLQRQLQATRERFVVGEITRTDVAQAEARLASAIARREQSAGAVETARAVYAKVVGKMPGAMVLPVLVPDLPATRDEAIALARRNNLQVLATAYLADARAAGIRLARGEMWPTLSLQAKLGRTWQIGASEAHTETAELVLSLSFPLYQQGVVDSQLRSAKHTAGQYVYEAENARRQAIALAVQRWETLETAKAQIRANKARIVAAEVALAGVEQEAQVGSRTVLDVLNAEQERLDAQIALARVERDERVAAFQILAAVGRMTVQDRDLPLSAYDPKVHYHNIRDEWFGTSAAAEADARGDQPLTIVTNPGRKREEE
ncbi:MAG: outer membrane channel protein [Rhodospirillaceae bacterium]|nr:MAG: outer membrane channel protein [Rhodospirillaceae bacterium]